MTNEEDKPRRLRDVAEQLAASIPDSPQRGRDVSNEPRIPKGQSGGGQWTRDASAQETRRSRRDIKGDTVSAFIDRNRRSNRLANTHTPAPFLDDHGNPVLNGKGEPMQRPADVDMRFFVDKGLEAAQYVIPDTPELSGLDGLFNFQHGGAWDIQRIGPVPKYDEAFVDAANVAIGLYSAAAGIPTVVALEAADHYAQDHSHYRGPMDATYQHLSKQDADDIRQGYSLYQSGKIGPSGAK